MSCSPAVAAVPTRSWTRCWAPTPAGSRSCTPGPAGGRRWRGAVSARRVYLAVGAAAAAVPLGGVWDGLAPDEPAILPADPPVARPSRVLAGLAPPLASIPPPAV